MQTALLVRAAHPINTLRRHLHGLAQAVQSHFAPYKISVYENGSPYEWGAHYAHTRAQALAWLACYPRGTQAIVWGRGWRVVAQRTC